MYTYIYTCPSQTVLAVLSASCATSSAACGVITTSCDCKSSTSFRRAFAASLSSTCDFCSETISTSFASASSFHILASPLAASRSVRATISLIAKCNLSISTRKTLESARDVSKVSFSTASSLFLRSNSSKDDLASAYVYIYIHTCVYIYIYLYTHVYRYVRTNI